MRFGVVLDRYYSSIRKSSFGVDGYPGLLMGPSEREPILYQFRTLNLYRHLGILLEADARLRGVLLWLES